MQELDDNALLREYVIHGSEEAFATLVARHINKIYSVAWRHTRNPHQAEEITQAVFVILARKANKLHRHAVLSGWLYETSRLTAMNFVRSEIRRARREEEAHMQTLLNETESDVWPQIAPLLDTAMAGLSETDRHAIVLRFFDKRSMNEVGAVLGTSEDAAEKRISRAVEKLRKFLTKRGVILSAAAIVGQVSANSVQAAPAMLAKTVTAIAIAKGAAASGSTLTLIKGALKVMAWTKAKTAVVVGIGVLLAAGTTTVAIKEFTPLSAEDVFKHPEDSYLEKAPPVVVLRPSSFGPGTRLDHMHGPPFSAASERFVEVGQSLNWVISVAYDIGPERMILPPDMPMGKFDFLVAVPTDPKGALREEIKRQFGLVAHTEIQQRDVLVLKVVNPAAPGLKVNGSKSTDHGINQGTGRLALINFAMSGSERALAGNDSRTAVVKTNIDDSIVNVLGGYYLGMPVIDETSLTESYDINLQWDGKLKWEDQRKAIEVALHEQLGLELIHTNMPIEVLVVEYQDGHQVEPPLRQASWAVAGYDTPEGAFQSALAAMSKGDVKTYLACLTPDYQKRFRQTDAKGKSENEIAAHIKHMAGEIVAFQIISKENISDDESVLYIRSTRLGNAKVTMKKIKGEWKMDGEPH